MPEQAELAAPAPPAADRPEESLARELGIDPGTARALWAGGLRSPEAIRAADDDALRAAGLPPESIGRLRVALAASGAVPPRPVPPSPSVPVPGPVGPSVAPTIAPAAAPPEPAAGGSELVRNILRNVHGAEKPAKKAHAVPVRGESAEVLRKWVSGDDHALESWIQSSETPRPGAVPSPAPETAPGTPPALPPTALPTHLVEREETVVRWLTDLLDRVKSDQFDPISLLQELQELQREHYDERERRVQLEEQLEQVKRGSIAVIKYVRNREAKAREELLQEKDTELAELKHRLATAGAPAAGAAGAAPASGAPAAADPAAVQQIEAALRAEFKAREAGYVESENHLRERIAAIEAELAEAKRPPAEAPVPPGEVAEAVRRATEQHEKELGRREGELRRRFEEIRARSEEINREREALDYKEKEISGREQEATLRAEAVEVERRRVEELKQGLPPEALAEHPEVKAQADRLATLEEELRHKEEEIARREAFLQGKMGELDALQKQAAEREADRIRFEAADESASAKVRSGVRRLDDLLFGGLPLKSQVLVNGPAHTGKDILARLFMAEGLKNGQGTLWVLTDRTFASVREEMGGLLPNYGDYEKRGFVRYVDLYSRSVGATEGDRSAKLLSLNDKVLLDQLTSAVNTFAGELKERTPSYRLVFESVSTVTAYLDATATFRFLQPFTGRRKIDGAVGYYVLETGMHSEADLQTLEHMMDGSINLKIEQLKTFLSVKGLSEVQSRAWVGYTFSRKAFSLGSFSLDHIR